MCMPVRTLHEYLHKAQHVPVLLQRAHVSMQYILTPMGKILSLKVPHYLTKLHDECVSAMIWMHSAAMLKGRKRALGREKFVAFIIPHMQCGQTVKNTAMTSVYIATLERTNAKHDGKYMIG